jgi:hypothetical protein
MNYLNGNFLNAALYRIVLIVGAVSDQTDPVPRDKKYQAYDNSHPKIERANWKQNPITPASNKLTRRKSDQRKEKIEKQTKKSAAEKEMKQRADQYSDDTAKRERWNGYCH